MNSSIERIISDFDQLAVFEERWNHNNHYYGLIQKEIRPGAGRVLEVGCGRGDLVRLISDKAEVVTGIDLSPKMIEVAESRSKDLFNVVYETGDYLNSFFPKNYFDSIVSVATVHHFDFPLFVGKAKSELKTGGKLVIVDLYRHENILDYLTEAVAVPANLLLKKIKNGSLNDSAVFRKLMDEHGKTDTYRTFGEIKSAARKALAGASLRRLLLWRYILRWTKKS